MADKEIDALSNQEVVKQGNNELRRTVQHLPAFYRTDTNQRFLSSTVDPLVQKGTLDRLDGFIGKQDAYTRKVTDSYISATSRDRMAYQLDPTVTYTDRDTTSVNPEDQVKFTGTYDDYINQIKYFGGKVDNHDRLNKETVYSWNPAVDYDKLINYREYYWLPDGPNTIQIDSVGPTATVEVDVTAWPDDGSSAKAWKFGTEVSERNPQVTLYRGNTYKFLVDATGHPFYIMTEPYRQGISDDESTSTHYTTGVTNNGIQSGTVTFTVPTSAPDVLYYQCGNHDAMNGIFAVKTITDTTKINVDEDIIGAKNYSLRTLDLSNGMKIKFGTNVTDETTYKNKEFYVEGVGEAITLTNVENLITPESYATETTTLYDSAAYDTRPYAKAFYRPETLDYITIKRDSLDQNPWSRYNRWFHKAVIEKTADVSGYTATLKEEDRAKRPIIEFDSGLALYNHGTQAKNSVTLYDTVTTDAFSTIVNESGYIIDGLSLADGMRVIFAADTDPIVKNKIYDVNFVHASDESTIADSTAVISLTEATDAEPANNDSVFVELGTNNQGKTYYYNSTTKTWVAAQAKTAVNQQPLFGMWDNNRTAFDDATTYPNSTFTGAKVFEYKTSDSATTDTVLGIKVKYNTINNIGDIVFESDTSSGSFTYQSSGETITKNYAEGTLRYTTSQTVNNYKSAWLKRTNESKQRVIRTYIVDDTEKQLFPIDFYKDSVSLTDLEISVRVNGARKTLTTDYTLVDGTVNKYVKFVNELEVDDQIRIAGYSATKKVDGKGIYEIPENLSINAHNNQLSTFTYGQLLGHVRDIYEKNSDVTGDAPGSNNLRDKPDARLKGGLIQQHTGSLLPAVFGLIDQEANVLTAIDYCNREYEKFYNSFLTHAINTAYEGVVADRVDEIITAINKGRTTAFPFYYDDMAGVGENYSLRTYTVPDSSETEYAIDSVHSMTAPNNRAVYVYLNDVQLVKDTDYTVSTTDDSINITATLATDDIIKIRDYSDTTGSYIPSTPTKLGLYPKFTPEKFTDDTYITDTDVIRRHDGSIIKQYGDERDDLIMELEKRIYNNIKTQYDSTLLDIGDVLPSAFSSTEYTLTEVNNVLGPDFYVWAGRNNVQYINNTTFSEGSPFTYNYSNSTDRLNQEQVPAGHWRGLYKYFYDTDAPHKRPWEILGHSEKPSNWETLYGPAPYTSANDVLWDAIEAAGGRYGKSSIKTYLPVDASGNLLDPLTTGLIDFYNMPHRFSSWKFGDQAPAETAWRRSSAYPFSVIKMLALTKPAKFFGLFFDNSRLTENISNNLVDSDTNIRQKLSTAKYYIETSTNLTTDVTTRYMTAGYQPFVVNHLISRSLDPKVFYYTKMKELDIQLSYKLGGFTDKENIKVLTDSVSPGSTSGSKFLPDENYKILFRTSNPVNSFNYSGVLIEKNTDKSIDGSTLQGGYKILGYSETKPFFTFYYPNKNVTHGKVSVADVEAKTYDTYNESLEQIIPYGFVFTTIQEVVDFLMGYGHWLEKQGFSFDTFSQEIKEVVNWKSAVKEFLFWTTQNWAEGAAITVSPGAPGFSLTTDNSIVGQLRNLAGDYSLLDAGGRKLDVKDISTKRIGTTFNLTTKTDDVGLFNIALNTVQKEHMLLFDNTTVFSDIIYDSYTGFRQQRLKLVGWKTAGWNGDYYAPGFIFDAANVTYWTMDTDYKIGDSIEYQGKFYVSKYNHTSTTKFVTDNWILKNEKPAPQLIPNFDYKITQFNDFYNLESTNFDESQQELAQRLVGYQSRDYLENLFVNDISQYKFYQGYTREKGTQESIDKLLKARYEEQDIILDLYPEWMIRTGRFGNVDSVENIQINLENEAFYSDIHSIELFATSNETKEYARSIFVEKGSLYSKPVEYTPSTTFSQYNYSNEGVDRDTVQVYKTAGYPQLNQVQHTLFNINELLDIDVTALKQNELIWVANKTNNDWDVFRFTSAGIKIASLRSINDATQLEITFTDSHNLSAGTLTTMPDYFAISNAEDTTMNGVYSVFSVESHKTVVVNYTGSVAFIPQLADGSTADSYGNIYKFISVRLSSMDNVNDLLNYSVYQDKNDAIEKEGDKVFADSNSDGYWNVYEKQDPYTQVRTLSPSKTADLDFGYQIVARNDGRTVVVSAPTQTQGYVHFLFRSDSSAGTAFSTQSSATMTDNDDSTSKLGYSLSMSTDENFVVAGAPYTNTISSDGSTRYSDNGLVKIYLWEATTFKYGILNTITPPEDGSTTDSSQAQNFGWSHKICEPGANSVRTTATKYLFVGAPGYDSDTGQVYMYEWGVGSDGSTYDTWTNCLTITSDDPGEGKRFGHRLQANDNGDILVISSKAPGQAGKVEVYRRTSQSNDDSTDHSFTLVQTLEGVSVDGSSLNTQFGEALSMSKDGTTLIVGAPGHDDSSQTDMGVIYYYKWDADGDSTLSYTLQQTIKAPDTQANMKFGSTIDINDSGTRLVIGAEKFSNNREMKFDTGETTFDLQDTTIVDENVGSGSAYTATKYNTKFVIDDRLVTTSVSANDDFGRGVCAIDQTIFVGAPDDNGNVGSDGSSLIDSDGTVTCFDLTKDNSYAWNLLATESALIDISKLGQVFEFNKSTKQIRDYYDLYDPVKGRILGVADREINIKTPYDPAQYNFGTDVNSNLAWGEEHIGEVWWDLSTVKWLWYEQDTQEYKTNTWGKTFPGSSIDIYEWTESLFPPSRYINQQTSGTVLNSDDSKYTVKQRYSSAIDGFIDYYYYWVKNKSTLPINSAVTRKNTTAYISNLIENPTGYDIKYYAPTGTNKLIYFSGSDHLYNDNSVLNVDIRTNTFEGDSHSVWKLVREGDKDYRPGTQVETRWWDSLIGSNATGNLVPDPDLTLNERYGNNVRPRQSWYVDRYDALKEIIDYANSVLKKHQLVGLVSLDNLNSFDPEPTVGSLEWDAKVDTYADLTYINTADLSGSVKYLVQADETANGFWAIYTWDGTEWSRTKIQTYNTSKYWSYIDWYDVSGSMIHDENTKIDKQVTYEYDLDSLDIEIGQHAKVTSADTGGWKLFMKTSTGWENVGTENGAIRLSTKLYDYTQDATGFAGSDNFDDNFFDQEPALETRKVLTALRDDLFINDLALEYNTLFFTGLRKVLAEQSYVDWMFKTSFVNARNSVRRLDQRKTYTIGTDTWVEEYINEVKPFHTKLREYKLGYQGTDTQDGMFTDFDSPPFYDTTDSKIRPLNVSRDSAKLTEYPWQMWNDYHKKHVASITVTSGGSGYTKVPTVTILGGTVNSTGPFQIYDIASSGISSGTQGYYYPLYTSETQSNIADTQNSGAGTSREFTFDNYTGTFYQPTSHTTYAQSTQSGTYKLYETPNTTQATATAKIGNGAVQSITVTGIGANYTSTPTILITGGADDGTSPTDKAKAYVNLNNDLVRDFDTTLKFDRISSTSSVADWAASTAYAYGDLLRYNNQLYKATSAFTSTTDFDDNEGNVYKVYGDETGLSAADRTKGFYTPGSGMPGNELSQVMLGVDYGGTIVTGLLFSQEGGWDKSGWYDYPWDHFGASDVKSFRADGSSATFIIEPAPSATTVYQVYATEDDSTRRKLSDVFRGDGSTTAFTLSVLPNQNALIEFIPFDSDGVLTPTDDRTLDNIVRGGLFASSLGTAPSDILMEGDAFVTPETSYAPEEAIPGQLFDTVDIKVYTSPESGVPFISDLNHRGDGSTTTFAIGDYPGTLGSVTVTVNNSIKKLTTDYTINVRNKTITFGTAPVLNALITTKTFAISGKNYRVLDQYTGDGSTVAFTTSTRGEFNLDSTASQIYVTIDGVPSTAFTSSTTANTITLTFTSAPAANSWVQVAGFNQASSTRAYASIRNEKITYDGSTARYALTYPPGSIGPYAGLTIVEHNGKVLRGPDNSYYKGDGSTYSYAVVSGLGDDSTIDPVKVITSASQVEVFLNGTEKLLNTDYTVDTSAQTITFITAPSSTDVIAISTIIDNQYLIEGGADADIILRPTQIASDGITLSADDVLSVTTFNNALGTKLRREVLQLSTSGNLNLRFTPLKGEYTYVWLNGEQLNFSADYTISGTSIVISGRTITTSDRIDVMYFALDQAIGATGFRIFKDMLNRTFYRRISKGHTTKLRDDIIATSTTIQVVDGTVLSVPNVTFNLPGVIMVDKERIEYFTKDGDTLGQLRRGTLGTGIKDHSGGAEVVDAGGLQTIPYVDTVYTDTHTGDGSTTTFTTTNAIASASELDIFIGGQRLLLTSEDGSTINYSIGGDNPSISSAGFVQATSALTSTDSDIRDVKFNTDGTKMFVLGRANDGVYEYTLSTAFDVSTITYVRTLDISAQDTAANSISFNTDGTKLFVLGQNDDKVSEYALSTAFDLSTASFTDGFDVSSQEGQPYGLAFNNDGTKMYVCGWLGDDINEYTLSTGFDVSSATYSQVFDVSSETGKPSAVQFDTDGTTMYVLGGGDNPEIYQYTLTTAFDVSTASYSGNNLQVKLQETKPRGFCFNPTMTKLFVCGWNGDDINEYTLDAAAIILTTAPASGTQIKILHKKGQVWYSADPNGSYPADGKGLQASTTAQAKFIAEEPTNAPE